MSAALGASGQRGMALLTVLLLVAVMTLLAVALLDDLRFALRRTGNAAAMTQAQWYALGSEAVARQQLQAMARDLPGRTTLDGGWNGRTLSFPIEHGLIAVRLRDRGACFNLNSVVSGGVEHWQHDALGVQQYLALLAALDIAPAQAQALAGALVDWIDSDAVAQPHGAEDPAYVGAVPPRLTAGTLLADPGELGAISGYTATVRARLRPHVCAWPEAALSPLNVNTLEPADAPVLVAITRGALSPAAARAAIAARPAGGWREHAAFWALPSLRALQVPAPVLEQVQLHTQYFGLRTQVDYAGAQVQLEALLRQDRAGQVRLLSRRWNFDE